MKVRSYRFIKNLRLASDSELLAGDDRLYRIVENDGALPQEEQDARLRKADRIETENI